MKHVEWSEQDNNKLLKLKSKNIPYREMLEFFPGRTQDALRNQFYMLTKQTNNSWLSGEKETVAFLDIETTGFSANFDYMLSWSLKYLDGEVKHDVLTKADINSCKFDLRILKSLLKELVNVDVVVTYYGKKFDVPFIRTRAMMLGLDFPTVGTIKHIDLYYSVKYKMKLGRNSLEQATTALGIEGKNHVLGAEWMKARVGDKASLDYVSSHNDLDVIILEELYKKLFPLVKLNRGQL